MNTNFGMVNVDDLLITHHHGTQRIEGIAQRRVAKMAAEWDPSHVGTITVSKRTDGSLFVPDGAHRPAAAREVGQRQLPAVIHEGLTRKQEADLFVGLNNFNAPSAISNYLGRVGRGDSDAQEIKDLLTKHGWRVGQNADDGYVSAISAVESVYRNASGVRADDRYPEILDWVLDVITASWEHDRDGVHGSMIKGLGQMVGRFGSDIDTKKLVIGLSATRPRIIIGKATAVRDAVGGTIPAHVAKVLVGIHNSRRRTNLLPEWVWTR